MKAYFLLSKEDKYIYNQRVLSFIGENGEALKRRKYKGFCVFFVIWDVDSAFKIQRK